jgi:hypothetical protein
MDLTELFTFYGSDKHRNGYSSLYTIMFDHKRTEKMNVAEIGIGTMIPNACSSMVGYALPHYKPGGSLRAWSDFFVNSQIYGFDIQLDTQFTEDRIKTFLCDSSNSEQVAQCVDQMTFDIIIDDGNHSAESQYNTLRSFYPYLNAGGIYIIEDIYPGSEVSENPKKLQEIVGNDVFFFSGVKNNLCIIYKKSVKIASTAF